MHPAFNGCAWRPGSALGQCSFSQYFIKYITIAHRNCQFEIMMLLEKQEGFLLDSMNIASALRLVTCFLGRI